MKVIRKVTLQNHHFSPGRTRHYDVNGGVQTEFPPFKSLAITVYPRDPGYYFMHVSENRQCTDAWHSTLDEAFHQAKWELGVRRDEWIETSEPF